MEPIDASIDIGLGLTVVTRIKLALESVPESGADWPADLDYIRLEVALWLPTQYGEIHPALVNEDIVCAGEDLAPEWGTKGPSAQRFVRTYVSAPTLSAAKALAAAWIESAVAALRTVTSARAARLAMREQRIREGMAS